MGGDAQFYPGPKCCPVDLLDEEEKEANFPPINELSSSDVNMDKPRGAEKSCKEERDPTEIEKEKNLLLDVDEDMN